MSIDRPDEYQVNQTGTGAPVSPPDDQAPKPLMASRKRGRNLGLGSRNLTRAGKTCAHQSGKAFATRGTLAERWSVFAKCLEQTQGIKRMQNINREHVMAWQGVEIPGGTRRIESLDRATVCLSGQQHH
jgi:hypothetical protein